MKRKHHNHSRFIYGIDAGGGVRDEDDKIKRFKGESA